MISKQISFNLHQATIGENVHLFDVGHLTMWQTFSDSFEVSVSCTCFLSLAPLKEKSTSAPQSNFNISKVRLYLCQSDPPLQFLFLFHFFFFNLSTKSNFTYLLKSMKGYISIFSLSIYDLPAVKEVYVKKCVFTGQESSSHC